MSVVIGVPVTRISCGVLIDRVRAWSAIEEVIFLLLTQEPLSMRAIADLTNQPHQIVLAAIARLMQFRLIELRPTPEGAAFGVSAFGLTSFTGGHPLPTFPTRTPRRFSFVVEAATGDFFPAGPLQLMSLSALKRLPQARILRVEGGEPDRSQPANFDRLTRIAARRADERVAGIDGRAATINTKEYMVVRVVGDELQGLPDTAGDPLRELLLATAKRKASGAEIVVPFNGRKPRRLEAVKTYDCDFKADDLIVGGDDHRELLLRALREAHGRMIIHSTFLSAQRFMALMDGFHDACVRGVKIDLLWGDDDEELVESETKIAASDIMALADADPEMRGQFTVHMDGTQSHAKLLVWDTNDEGWVAVLGSCNWLLSGFQSVEISVVLRHQHVVADICEALQHMAGRRGVLDNLANELGITARDLQRERPPGGGTKVSVVAGTGHDALMREASLASNRRLLIGAHKFGSNARTGAILPSEAAAKREVASTVIYSRSSGPVEPKHARDLEVETAAHGVRLLKVNRPQLHGKFVAWDDDDVVITSLNWTSGAADPEHPANDLGIHLHAPGLATHLISQLRSFFPKALPAEEAPAAVEPPFQPD